LARIDKFLEEDVDSIDTIPAWQAWLDGMERYQQ